MSEINANFVVSPFDINITVDSSNIEVVAEPINLNLSLGGFSGAAGNTGELQYNQGGGVLGGIPNVTYASGNLSLGNIANVKLLGGNNQYFLQTDGTGNLTWQAGTGNATGNGTVGGANTQIQFNDSANFGGAAGFTFDKVTNVFSAPGNGVFTNNVSANWFIGNFSGNVSQLVNGNSNVIVDANANIRISSNGVANSVIVSGNILNVNNINVNGVSNLGSNSNVIILGGSNGQILSTNGSGNLNWISVSTSSISNGNSNVSIPSSNGDVNISANGIANLLIVSGNGVTLSGTTTVQQILEKYNANSSSPTGNLNYDLLDGAILYFTSNTSGNFNINFRGNSTQSLNNVMSNNQSMTCTFIAKNGATAYKAGNITIDGNTTSLYWSGNTGGAGNGTVNGIDVYTFNILKGTGTNNFTVISGRVGFI